VLVNLISTEEEPAFWATWRFPGHHPLRRAVASALDLAHRDPEAVRLAKFADQIAKRTD
jgi:hypothetical protein